LVYFIHLIVATLKRRSVFAAGLDVAYNHRDRQYCVVQVTYGDDEEGPPVAVRPLMSTPLVFTKQYGEDSMQAGSSKEPSDGFQGFTDPHFPETRSETELQRLAALSQQFTEL